MEVITYTKYIRISPKKLKALSLLVRGLSPAVALDRLSLTGGKKAKLLISSIKSAAADAKNNFKLDTKNLRIAKVEIGKGPFFKRWQPVSRGMAHQIKKRTSHLKVVLQEIPTIKSLPVKKERKKNGT